jgi:hypothetical protein
MAGPLSQFSAEELISYSMELLGQALHRLEENNVDGAAWRMADALGAISSITAPGTLGIDSFTGLGYKLGSIENDNPKQVQKTE